MPFYHPAIIETLNRIHNSTYTIVPLNELLDLLTDGTHHTPTYCDNGVKFISVTNVCENNIDFVNTKYISTKEHCELVKRCFPQHGDILLTKIGSIGRAAIVPENAPEFSLFVSVALLRAKENIDSRYLCAYLNTSIVQKQFKRHLKGIGVPDLHLENIANTQVILPDEPIRNSLTKLYFEALEFSRKMIADADAILASFEDSIVEQFELQNADEKKLCFAVKYAQIDGVIDVKRYYVPKSTSTLLSVSDVCDIVENKVNVSNYGNNIIDWIRIDDLPNQPLDIEEIRTQPANEVEGSFFEVKENDILVARLGPTILNQKIVMVRSLQRTTIASSEFLVLRCKDGYNPEAVMAVLKTDYYKDLMYSHSRGSTPSRYRLNREDMLKLPFPDIKEFQEELSTEANCVREKVKNMRIQAETDWQVAKEQFEKELLGE